MRKQLSPYEEAKAVRAMLDRGLTEDGAAQALGWPKHRVTARVTILELPERAQQVLLGDPDVTDEARAGRQARPRRVRQGRGRGTRAAPRRAPGGRDRDGRRQSDELDEDLDDAA